MGVITECRGAVPPASNPLHKVETTRAYSATLITRE
jgi:hypothetical protein